MNHSSRTRRPAPIPRADAAGRYAALEASARAHQRHTGAVPPSTVDTGARAEAIAVALLVERGYDIIERNYRCDLGELDIVAADGDVMVFVEVRSRADTDHGDAVESVDRRKQRKVTRVAEVYLQHRQPAFEEFRFDVVAINGDEVTLYEDAWRGGCLP